MDQFCSLKNDDYRRCSCSNRVYDLADARSVLQDAGDQLTVFTENLDVVGMTAAQAASMHTASDGENALTSDKSASKALLQAIMNSIRGEDTSVGGKYSDLNSISLSFDTTNAFGITDIGQAVAMYNGQNLYTAVYPQCRDAVRADCNDASLQRAVNAYLMAIEQDCNTVQTAIEEKQKQIKAAVREGSAMLDLARVENRQQHNSDTISACIANVQSAIQSEEVCGAGYHRCLDNGEFIDISTGAPIAGVVKFYELEHLLTFTQGVESADQKLSKVARNRTFVQNFEKRTKKFAAPALDKCREQSDTVWSEYLDQALLDIYYAQKAKVAQIRQGCFDFVSSCYSNTGTALTAAMKELVGTDSVLVLQPDKVKLTNQLCQDYVQSCNNMFDGNIIADYVDNRTGTDTLDACRAVARQCLDSFGGAQYQNFYYPYSGTFTLAQALDWFTLYDYSCPADGAKKDKWFGRDCIYPEGFQPTIKSPCAQQLAEIESCKDQLEEVFGGFDKYDVYDDGSIAVSGDDPNTYYSYTTLKYGTMVASSGKNEEKFRHRFPRPTGVATEVYNQILAKLSEQCTALNGVFIEVQDINTDIYGYAATQHTACQLRKSPLPSNYYKFADRENVCPRPFAEDIDSDSWGVCSCYENGYRRSMDGTAGSCGAYYCSNNFNSCQVVDDETCTYSSSDCIRDKLTHMCKQPSIPSGPWGNTQQSSLTKRCISDRDLLPNTVYNNIDGKCMAVIWEEKTIEEDGEEKQILQCAGITSGWGEAGVNPSGTVCPDSNDDC